MTAPLSKVGLRYAISVVAPTLALAFSVMACGPSSVSSAVSDVGDPVPAQDFVGHWAGVDVKIEEASGAFTLTPNDQGGGILISDAGNGLAVRVVSATGSQSPVLTGRLRVDTVAFSVPAPGGTSTEWDVQIVDPTTSKALLQVGGDSTGSYDLEQVVAIPTD